MNDKLLKVLVVYNVFTTFYVNILLIIEEKRSTGKSVEYPESVVLLDTGRKLSSICASQGITSALFLNKI